MELLRVSSSNSWSTLATNPEPPRPDKAICHLKVSSRTGFLVSRVETQRLRTPVTQRVRLSAGRRGFEAGHARASVAEIVSNVEEILLEPIKCIDGRIKLPGSKSLSNRILLLAALSEVCGLLGLPWLLCARLVFTMPDEGDG